MRVILAALLFCAMAAPAMAQEHGQEFSTAHKFYLVLTYVTPGRDTPDIRQKFPMESVDECEEAAHEFNKEFMAHGPPKKIKDGVVAGMSACLMLKPDESDL